MKRKGILLILICLIIGALGVASFVACNCDNGGGGSGGGGSGAVRHAYIAGWAIESDPHYYVTEYKDLPAPAIPAGSEFLGYFLVVTPNNGDVMTAEVRALIGRELPYNRQNLELLINGTTDPAKPVMANLVPLFAPIGGRAVLDAWETQTQEMKQARVAELVAPLDAPEWSGGDFNLRLQADGDVSEAITFILYINGVESCYSENFIYHLKKGDFIRVTVLFNGEETRLTGLSVTLSLKPVVKMGLTDGTNEIQAATGKTFGITCVPHNPAYIFDCAIERVVLNDGGEFVGECAEEYAYIGTGSILRATERITAGSKIYVRVDVRDRGADDVMCIEVVYTPMTSMFFYYSSAVTLGETVELSFSFNPANATVNLESLPITVTLATPEFATLVKTGERKYILSVTNDALYAGESIVLIASDGETALTGSLYLEPIYINAIYLYNTATNAELLQEFTMTRGETLEFYWVIDPPDGTALAVSVNVVSSTPNFGIYIEETANSLTVKGNAPVGMTLTMNVTVGRTASKTYKITVV